MIGSIARIASALRRKKRSDKVFPRCVIAILFGFHFSLTAVIAIGRSSATEFRHHLHADSNRERLRRLGTEIAPLIVIIFARVDKAAIVVEMVFKPIVLHVVAIGYLALYLHPSVSKRDVLKIDKSGTHLRKRTGVVRLRVVAHSETVVHQWRRTLFHAHRQIHSAILHLSIKLLQPYCVGMMPLHCRCIDGLVILRIFRLITSHKVGTETIAEPLAQVKILQCLDAKLNRLWLRKRPATVGHHKIWRKVAAAGIRAHRAFNLQWRFCRCHSDSRKRYKRGND